jgi:hypothetical protein
LKGNLSGGTVAIPIPFLYMKMLSKIEQNINIKTYMEYFEIVYFFKRFKFGDSFDREISVEIPSLLKL